MRTRLDTDGSRRSAVHVLAVVALGCLVATTVWFGAHAHDDTGDDHSSDAGASLPDTTAGDRTLSEVPDDTVIAQVAPRISPADGVSVPTGIDQVDGYPIGFPQSDLGAVALQIAVARAQVGFDYDQAVAVAGIYAHPEDRTVFEARARAAVAQRRQQAGVPVDGEVAAPAAYAVTPIAFTVEELDAGFFAVNLLSYVTLTTVEAVSGDGASKDGLYAGTQLMRWSDGDWRLVRGSPEVVEDLLAQGQPPAVAPETAEFERAGWVLINGASQ